jgi:phosphonoacetate hydrolase
MTRTTVEVNGRSYALPERPRLVVTLDGTAPAYLDTALESGKMPNLSKMLADEGTYALGRAQMPTFTNPNNVGIVTGVHPAVHGITGNYYRGPDGVEVQLDDASFLRAETVHAGFRRAGAKVLAVTAKEKLKRLLQAGDVPCVSAERAAEGGLDVYGIDDVPALVGREPPDIYDPEISLYALEIGLAVHARVGGLDLLYVSLTDFVQHTYVPEHPIALGFYGGIDALLGRYLEAGFVVGLVADHGMHAKQNEDGSPRIHYLQDILEEAGCRDVSVVLPITDPYVRHHGALGSFAWVDAPAGQRDHVREVLAGLTGIEEVYDRAEACVIYQHPIDRVGDIAVSSDSGTALGRSKTDHDLSVLPDALRSHGGRHEQVIPIIVSHRLSERYEARLEAHVNNSDIHDLVLNGVLPNGASSE